MTFDINTEQREEFLTRLAEALQIETLDESTELTPEHWDSVAVLSAISVIDELFDVRVPPRELTACTSPRGVLDLIGTERGSGD